MTNGKINVRSILHFGIVSSCAFILAKISTPIKYLQENLVACQLCVAKPHSSRPPQYILQNYFQLGLNILLVPNEVARLGEGMAP
jgi:hypothetical protein